MLYLLRLSAALFIVGASSALEFMIKHKESGKYIHPAYSHDEIPDDDPLVIYSGYHHDMYMTFDIIDGQWGYIRHVASGKIFHPEGGLEHPGDNTNVVLYTGLRPWAKFALDQVNDRLIHNSWTYIHPSGGGGYPDDSTPVMLHHDVHKNMKFKLVSTSNPDEEVFPYGDAQIVGDWKLVYSVENPLATHTETYEVQVGKSESESISESFQFVWEAEGSAQYYFSKMSTSASLTEEIQTSSAETWEAQITKTDSVEVVAGETVAVWQRYFIGDQLGHKAVHHSTMIADTNSPNIKPDDYAYTRYRFI